MDRSRLRPLLLQVVGLLFHFLGLFLFVLVAVDVFFSSPERSIENVSSSHVAWMAVGLVMIVGGRVISWWFGEEGAVLGNVRGAVRGQRPGQSRLRELGYAVPADTADSEDGQFEYEDGSVYVVCAQCGARNEQEYDFCSDCSTKLPE